MLYSYWITPFIVKTYIIWCKVSTFSVVCHLVFYDYTIDYVSQIVSYLLLCVLQVATHGWQPLRYCNSIFFCEYLSRNCYTRSGINAVNTFINAVYDPVCFYSELVHFKEKMRNTSDKKDKKYITYILLNALRIKYIYIKIIGKSLR